MTAAPRTVLFDLFGTLIPGGSRAQPDAMSHEIAAELAVPPGPFATAVHKTFDARMRGELGDVRATLAALAHRLGRDPDDRGLAAAERRRLDFTIELHRRTWARESPTALRAAGLGIAVVSDCSAETPEVWPQSPLGPLIDRTSFSCVTGVRKPDPRAYLIAVDALGVAADECAYVGDGGSHELTGAERLGMLAIRYAPSVPDDSDVVEAGDSWRGPVVRELAELATLLGR